MKKKYVKPWFVSSKIGNISVLSASGGYVDGEDTILDFDQIGLGG